MTTLDGRWTPSNIRDWFINHRNDPLARNDGTIELLGASFLATEPAIFGKPNEYIQREIQWYESMSLNVRDIPGDTPAIWKAIAAEDGTVNSNYGYLFWSPENHHQARHVVDMLVRYPETREAVAIYNRPTMHEDAFIDGRHDFVCTNAVHYELRNGRLNLIVQMRSNDVVFGYKNDYAWQKHTQLWILDQLSHILLDSHYVAGDIYWQAGSMHIYRRHWHYLGSDVEESI